MNLHSWGNYPIIESETFSFIDRDALKKILTMNNELIPYGNGRSYGDSALAERIIWVKSYNYFLDFDQSNGILLVQSGVLLSEILNLIVPKGWFLKVTPGTKYITIGGAIASDVHGKNHHLEGCFSECVIEFSLMLPKGTIVKCSKTENSELFKATCGGMGLTGVILDAKISLKKTNSKNIDQTTIKTNNLKETFEAFEKYGNSPYSVAWIDCFAEDDSIGKCLLRIGDFSDDGNLDYLQKKKVSIPFYFPSFTINTFTIKMFNKFYYSKVNKPFSKQKVDLDTFFYPLDAIENWNRIYGKKGFTQYQFILPLENSYVGLMEILKKISNSGRGSFLAVLKLYGKANENYLSFPMEGYSLALDFKIENGLFEFLDELDQIVLKYRGRIYLTKDARVNKSTFEQGYPKINEFRKLRDKYKMNKKFNSLQSKRVGI